MSSLSFPHRSKRAVLAMRGNTSLLLSLVLSLCLSHALQAADNKPASSTLTAAQIVDKHLAARGGLQAWHSLQTLSVSGKMDAGRGDSATRSLAIAEGGVGASVKRAHASTLVGNTTAAANQQVQLPFTLELMRPHKSRLEIEFAGKTAVQVYDGTNGWKLRPFLNRNDVEPFSAEEAKSAADQPDMDGPLVDYAAKGTRVALEGMEPVEGQNAYKLKLTAKDGTVQHIWIDAQSFLDVKIEGTPRRMDGKMRAVYIYQRDFRSEKGVQIPHLLETAVEGYPDSHKMIIEKVAVNPALNDTLFAKPSGA